MGRRGRGEGGLFYSEAKGVWIGRPVLGAGPDGALVHAEVTGKTRKRCLERMEEERRKFAARREGPGAADYLHAWLEDVARPAVRATTYEWYEQMVRLHLAPALAGLKLAELTTAHVTSLLANLSRAGMPPSVRVRAGQVLVSALRHAAASGLAVPVMPRGPRGASDDVQPLPFSRAEAARILAAAAGRRHGALAALAFGTGARLGELLGLGREHVCLDPPTIRIERTSARVRGGLVMHPPKTRRGRRTVELPAFAAQALRRHLDAADAAHPLVFCTATGGALCRSTVRKSIWMPLLKAAGVPYRRFHVTRHTHISELLSAGESVPDVARRVGDRPEMILKAYAHCLPGNTQRLLSRLDEWYGDPH